MRQRSLLGRIAKHGVSLVRDPREDRLTEIWAAIFASEPCRGFARHVALEWLDAAARDPLVDDPGRFRALHGVLAASGPWRCEVETQVPATLDDERRRPDLLLTFSGPASVSLWIEVKHGTPPHDGQLAAYVRLQAERRLPNAAVLLVAPRSDFSWFRADQLSPAVPRLSWERTAESICSFSGDGDDPVRRFLLEELWSYMRDEALTDPERLTDAHVAALSTYREARRALERLCASASDQLTRTWGGTGRPGTYPERGEPRQYWWSHQPDDLDGLPSRDWWWDWVLLMDGTEVLKDADPRPALLVGVTGNPGSLRRLPEPVVRELSTRGFLVLGPGASNGSYDYIKRCAYLDRALLGDGDLEAQARTLAEWLDTAFRELREVIAPATTT